LSDFPDSPADYFSQQRVYCHYHSAKNVAELQNLAINNAYEKVTKYLNQNLEGLNLIVSGKKRRQ